MEIPRSLVVLSTALRYRASARPNPTILLPAAAGVTVCYAVIILVMLVDSILFLLV
jgi:hypothetical protein